MGPKVVQKKPSKRNADEEQVSNKRRAHGKRSAPHEEPNPDAAVPDPDAADGSNGSPVVKEEVVVKKEARAKKDEGMDPREVSRMTTMLKKRAKKDPLGSSICA